MNTQEENRLMIEVRDGNLDSLVPLFDEYNEKLYNYFLRRTRNRETSKDLTQNVFARVMKYRHTIRDDSKFRPWLFNIARNVQIDHYHENRHYSESAFDEQYSHEGSDAMEEMEKREKVQMLNEALKMLPDEHRELIELSRFQGMKYDEISEMTGSSVGAIKVKVHRAMNRLREVYFQIA